MHLRLFPCIDINMCSVPEHSDSCTPTSGTSMLLKAYCVSEKFILSFQTILCGFEWFPLNAGPFNYNLSGVMGTCSWCPLLWVWYGSTLYLVEKWFIRLSKSRTKNVFMHTIRGSLMWIWRGLIKGGVDRGLSSLLLSDKCLKRAKLQGKVQKGCATSTITLSLQNFIIEGFVLSAFCCLWTGMFSNVCWSRDSLSWGQRVFFLHRFHCVIFVIIYYI